MFGFTRQRPRESTYISRHKLTSEVIGTSLSSIFQGKVAYFPSPIKSLIFVANLKILHLNIPSSMFCYSTKKFSLHQQNLTLLHLPFSEGVPSESPNPIDKSKGKYHLVNRILIEMDVNDPHSLFLVLLMKEPERLENLGLNGDSNPDFCNAGAMLYQLSWVQCSTGRAKNCKDHTRSF